MRQARVLTDPEFKRLLAVVAQRKNAARDRIALMLSHLAGLRVGEWSCGTYSRPMAMLGNSFGFVVSKSTISDRYPLRPKIIARRVPCPVPVKRAMQRDPSATALWAAGD